MRLYPKLPSRPLLADLESLEQFETGSAILDAKDFARNYSPEDEQHIGFAWNGKHADGFVDSNMLFRTEVCSYFLENKEDLSLPLIAALFKAETLFAKEAWGVNRVVSSLAQELLERGGADYLDVYMAGARCGMDAFIESGNITLSRHRCRELFAACEANAAVANGAEKQWSMLAERFAFLLTRANP